MYLIIGLVLVAVLAYFLAQRDVDRKTIKASRELSNKARVVGDDLQTRVKAVTRQSQGKPETFIAWALGTGKSELPEDFNGWFSGLDEQGQKAFSKSLGNYVDSLGMSLPALTSGRLDQQTEFKQVFIETLVIYSEAYRKIAVVKAKPASESETTTVSQTGEIIEEIKPAEKASSRRG